MEVPLALRVVALGSTISIGLVSKVAEAATDGSSAGGYATAAIIAASCAGASTIIGAVAGAIVKVRNSGQRRSRARAKSRTQLLREQRRLQAQLADLEEAED